MLVDLDEQTAVGHRLGRPGHAAVQTLKGVGAASARHADAVGDLSNGPDGGEVLFVPGHEQNTLLIAGVDRQRQ